MRLSPDGRHLTLLNERTPEYRISIYDLERGILSRFSEHRERSPAWSPNGRRIAFTRWEMNRWNVFVRSADATGSAERLLDRMSIMEPLFWTPDGSGLVVHELPLGGSNDPRVLLVALDGDLDEEVLLEPSDVQRAASLSPDGRYVAYDSGGGGDVYVRPFPQLDSRRWVISTGGGASPQWVDDGRRILYRTRDAIMEVEVETDPELIAGRPRVIAQAPMEDDFSSSAYYDHRSMVVTRDDGRILVLSDDRAHDDEQSQRIVVVSHWLDQLERLVPTK
jgi:Tol biopolymer transport system component